MKSQQPPNASALAAFDGDNEESGESDKSSPHRSGPHRIGAVSNVPARKGEPARKSSEPRTGAVFASRYRIVRHIANGGMGAVWEAEDLAPVEPHCRRVALKILTQWGEVHDEARERFRRETALASGLVGDQFARVLGNGLEGGVPYIALELFEGETLHDRLEGRVLSPGETLEILRQAAAGLDTAHSFGIVHRDISPKNLFLAKAPDGTEQLKILDFGIAKHGLFDAKLTEPGTLMGSLQYMSPEQVRSASSADASSDLWSLAVVLYRCLLGRHPFKGENGQILVAITAHDHPAPSSISPKLGDKLDQFFATALAKDCRQRYRTGAAMVGAFEEAMAELRADPPPPATISVVPPSADARATVLARPSYSEFAANITRSNSDAPTADGATNPLREQTIPVDSAPDGEEALAVEPNRQGRVWLLGAIALALLLVAIVLFRLTD